jgi:hypothetical protein
MQEADVRYHGLGGQLRYYRSRRKSSQLRREGLTDVADVGDIHTAGNTGVLLHPCIPSDSFQEIPECARQAFPI